MFSSRLSLCLLAALVAAPTALRAEAAPPAAASQDATLAAERQRLRQQLDQVNAEIDGLKRTGHDDGRLRARMADAEALARRLVDLERRMGLTAPPASPRPLPTAAPGDGPADLDAKADILADQARRVRAAADALDRRVTELKGRQELRRRAADLDRDPFAPLEGSKRRTVSVAAGADAVHPPVSGAYSPGTADRPGGSTSSGSYTSVGLSGSPQTASGSGGPVSNPTSSTFNVVAVPQVLSVELRELLDPATMADLGQLERGRAPTSVAALQRAVTALRARASSIDAQARAMRQAAAKP
jgi:hypothetical protein